MRNLKEKVILFFSFLLPGTALAAAPTPITMINPLTYASVLVLLSNIAQFFLIISFPLAALAVVIAAYYFLTAEGKEANIEKAKKLFFFAFWGIIFVVIAKALVSWLESRIGL